jgi:hypothetical protein
MNADKDQPARVEHEIEEVRDRLTGIVRELDRRRHAALDLRGQLRKHRAAVGVATASALLLVGGAIWLSVWLKARRARVLARAHRLRLALARMIANPDEVARPKPNVGKKVLSAAGSAAAGVLAKTLAERLVARPHKASP